MTDSRQVTSIRGSAAMSRAARARSSSSCRLPLSFSGLPGETSHHTRSSRSRLIAYRLMARWATCGGLNEPPSRPMRMPSVWSGISWDDNCDATDAWLNACPTRTRRSSRPRLPAAVNTILEARQLIDADRPAGVEFPGRDSDLRAEAELAAIGELRRGIVQHDRRVHLVEEFLRGLVVFRHDRIRMMRAVIVDMRDRAVDAVDHARGDDGIEIF